MAVGPTACDIGIVGLGVMGRNLLLNILDHGFAAAGLDQDAAKVQSLGREGAGRPVVSVQRADEFIQALRVPRAVLLLVPAGAAVDAVIAELAPLLSPGDLIIDAGNSHFRETERRERDLAGRFFQFMGMGVSGGEAGARRGPSLMPGGTEAAYARVAPILTAIAAQVGGEPCVAHLGPGAAGHYVKMVHNGIEYGVMELIAESYDLLRRGLGLTNDEISAAFAEWNRAELNSFLVEITADILQKPDDQTDGRLIDIIADAARQKGTGKWTSQDAMDLQTPAPTIDAAVAMRDLSDLVDERRVASKALGGPTELLRGNRATLLPAVRQGLFTGMLLTYAQGFTLLRAASESYHYGLKPETVARIWRGGCIIRAALLEDIRAAYRQSTDLAHPLLDRTLGGLVSAGQAALRTIVSSAAQAGFCAPAFMASLAYYDGLRTARLPTNLIQAQRDYFGAHTYERLDQPGKFHTQWN